MIKLIDEYGDHFANIHDVMAYHTIHLKRSQYETLNGMDWDLDEGNPDVSIFHVITKHGNAFIFGSHRSEEAHVMEVLDSCISVRKNETFELDVERPEVKVFMSGEEFRQTVVDIVPDDYTVSETYVDFGVKVRPTFLAKIGLYPTTDAALDDMERNFPDGGEWFVSIKANKDGDAYGEVWPHDDYRGDIPNMEFEFSGSCLKEIKQWADGIRRNS